MRLARLRGPMLVNLWAQWCEPCQAEAPHIAAFATTQKKVAVLGIDYSDPQPELAIQFAQLFGATYPQLSDLDNRLKGPLGVTGIPYTLLIDTDGRIVARHPGQFVSLERAELGGEGVGRMKPSPSPPSCGTRANGSPAQTHSASSRVPGSPAAPAGLPC